MSVNTDTAAPEADPREISRCIFAYTVQGNSELPQIHSVATIRVGTFVVDQILAGRLTWGEFVKTYIRREDTDRMGEAANAAHAKYGIGPRFDPEAPEGYRIVEQQYGESTEVRDGSLIRSASLNATVGQVIDCVRRTVTAYSAATLPRDFVQANVRTGPLIANDMGRGRPLVEELFANPEHAPKALALAGLFRQSQALLRSPTVLAEAKAYREAIKEKYAAGDDSALNGKNGLRCSEERNMRGRLIAELGSEAVQIRIAEESDFTVPDTAVQVFAEHASFHFDHEPRVNFDPYNLG